MDNALGVFVWTTLIAGSAIVLFLALPDVLFWLKGLKERISGTDREGAEQQLVAPTVTHIPKSANLEKRIRRRRKA